MKTQNNSSTAIQKIGSYLFNISALTGITALTFGLISCGGGGDASAPPPPTTTISSVTSNGRHGMVASSVQQTITLKGSNFAAGMTVSIFSPDGIIVNLPDLIPSAINTTVTPNVMNVPVTIANAPTARYVTLGIKSGNSIVATYDAFGVASISKTLQADIYPIFNASFCQNCHDGSPSVNNLDLSSYAATAGSNGIYAYAQSVGCTSRLRIKPGDPRITSSFLLDKINNADPCGPGNKMAGSPALTPQDIIDITEWVAAGAY